MDKRLWDVGEAGGGDGELAEAKAAVIGRNELVAVDAKAFGGEAGIGFGGEECVHEDAAAEDGGGASGLLAEADADLGDEFDEGGVEAAGEQVRGGAAGEIGREGADEGAGINGEGRGGMTNDE